MGRMLQKKKNRSSVPRATRKPKSKRLPIKFSPIIAANWDKHLTLSQNYHRLGLASKLNSRSGGTEAKATNTEGEQLRKQDPLAVAASRPARTGLKTTKVSRDAEGNIVKVIHKGNAANPLNDPLNAMEGESEEDQSLGTSDRTNKGTMNYAGIVPKLEAAALAELVEVGKRRQPRMQSQRERVWIEQLVEKYGQDIRSMSKDPKLNPNQQTEADIRKRIEVWRKSR